jgi:undecaprenyl-diphosphatase
MELQTLWQACFLGIIEGLTEFLPISSTGHLILLVDVLKFASPPGKAFEIVIQLGAILAIVCIYFKRCLGLAQGLYRQGPERHVILCLLAAFLPALLLGFCLHDIVQQTLFSAHVVATSLIVGGIAILVIERLPHRHHTLNLETMTLRQAIAIGCVQSIALIPGVSRSGATIMGGLMLGLDRKVAAEFSFLLAIPTMLAATTYSLYKNAADLSQGDWQVIAIGFVASFITAWYVVKWLLSYISAHRFTVFAWYRIALGILVWACM